MTDKSLKYSKIIVRIMGIILFLLGAPAAYYHYPIDHPWWFDLGGFILSAGAVLTPEIFIEIIRKAAQKLLK